MNVAGFLERVREWADARDDIQAVAVVGSQARAETPADRWSDIDVLLVVDDVEPFIQSTTWLEPLGSLLLTFIEATAVGGSLERRVLFESGEEVDFAVFPAGTIADLSGADEVLVLRRGHRFLLDRMGLAKHFAARAAEPAPVPAHDLPRLSHEFWYRVLWAAKKLRRGEVWIAFRSCNSNLQSLLVTLLRWRMEEKGVDAWHDGRFLERWADEQTLARLRGAAARYDEDDVARALTAIADLFADVERDYAEAAGLPVPVNQEEIRRRLRDVLMS